VLATAEGHRLETVIIPEGERRTICVSSQVGCSLDCTFCATGRLGFGRNLRADEIVDQWLHASLRLRERGEQPTHVVFMGMGEPLLNLRGVLQAVRVLCDAEAGGLSPRRITVSTAGVVPRIAELGRGAPVRLAISLHATTDALRDTLVPLNRRFPIAQLLEACRSYPVARRDRISFEYILIAGVNDSAADAQRLRKILVGIPAKVNLIPMNEHPGAPYRRPSDVDIDAFAGILAHGPVGVSVRRSRGDDIFAACGQLGALAQGTEPGAAVR
jgi:23S rRNA (adenine2503-C2)-methyltransferase